MTYSREQRERAVDLYIKYEHSAADVIHELGYPSRTILYVWYRERLEEERTGVPSGRSSSSRSAYHDSNAPLLGWPSSRITSAAQRSYLMYRSTALSRCSLLYFAMRGFSSRSGSPRKRHHLVPALRRKHRWIV